MRTDRAKAIKLRLEGNSYGQIQNQLGGVSKSTLSLWLSGVVLSETAHNKIIKRFREKSFQGLLRRNKNQTALAQKRAFGARSKAAKEIKRITDRELLLVGAALYWAEGYKRPLVRNGRELTHHYIGFTNSDPALIRAFMKFLKIICDVPLEKIKAEVRIFQHLNEKDVLNYWSKETGLLKENFTKTYMGISKSSMGKRPFNRLPYGVVQIRIGDTPLFHRIMGWIDGLKNQFLAPW